MSPVGAGVRRGRKNVSVNPAVGWWEQPHGEHRGSGASGASVRREAGQRKCFFLTSKCPSGGLDPGCLHETRKGRLYNFAYRSVLRITGKPVFGLPMITIFAFWLLASFSVASMPFHSKSCGEMPWLTMR